MKALIAVILLLVVAVASSIVRVSDGGNRQTAALGLEMALRASDHPGARELALANDDPPAEAREKSAATGDAAAEATDVEHEAAARISPDAFVAGVSAHVFKPQHLELTQLVEAVPRLFDRDAAAWKLRMMVDNASKQVVIIVTAQGRNQVLDFLKFADELRGEGAIATDEAALETAHRMVKAGRPRRYSVRRVNVGEIASVLRDILPPDPNRPFVVHTDLVHKQLFVSGSTRLLHRIEKFLKKLDAELPQRSPGTPAPDNPGASVIQSARIDPGKLPDIVRKLFAAAHDNEGLKIQVAESGRRLTLMAPVEMRERVQEVVSLLDLVAATPPNERDARESAGQEDPAPDAQATLRTAKVLKLKFSNALSVAEALRELYPDLLERALISPDSAAQSLWIRADEQTSAELFKIARIIDDEAGEQQARLKMRENSTTSQTKLFHLEKNTASAMKSLLKTLYPEVEASIAADDRSNTLLIRGSGDLVQEFEAVILRLDESPAHSSLARQSENRIGDEGADREEEAIPIDRRQLAQVYRDFDRQAAQLAAEIRDWHSVDGDNQSELGKLTPQLLTAVTQAFDARQRWQMAELAVLRARLQRLERDVKARTQAKMQIIERRMQELIIGKAGASEADDSAGASAATSGRGVPPVDNSVDDAVRGALERKLADAEVELELERIQVQARREQFERFRENPDFSDKAMNEIVMKDPRVATFISKIEAVRDRAAALAPNGRRATDEQILAFEKELEALRVRLRREAEQKVIDKERAAIENSEAGVKTKERYVELLKQKLRERRPSNRNVSIASLADLDRDDISVPTRSGTKEGQAVRSAADGSAADRAGSGVDKLRVELQQRLADAEIELELASTQLRALQEKFHETVEGFRVADEEVEKLVVSDPEIQEYQGKLRDVREKISKAAGKDREILEEDAARLERLLTAQRTSILPGLRRQAKRSANAPMYEALDQAEVNLQTKARLVELLRQKLSELPPPAEDAKQSPNAVSSHESGEDPAVRGDMPADPRQALIVAEENAKQAARRFERAEEIAIESDAIIERVRKAAQADPSKTEDLMRAEEGSRSARKEYESAEVARDGARRQLEFARDSLAARVRLLELELIAAELSQQQAERDLNAARRLLDKNLTSRDEFDKKVTALKSAELAVQRATISLELYRKVLGAKSTEQRRPDSSKKAEPSSGASLPVVNVGTQPATTASARAANPYKYDKQGYTWLRGTVARDAQEKLWRLRYIEESSDSDAYGGSLILTGSDKLATLVGDEIVYVRGRLDHSAKDHAGHPSYRVETLQFLKAKAK